ncbi:rRNA processing WD-repeat protein, putative [Plasmodium gallinaceum]|uniref:rRNA processing WD-repeat protein, putative n=1 Tax=Plasmodium gallinaceum TaxID=5849 RepID=A0A1J1H157_PLAGA|nr:rRNA processing WD-repeat protein, putative [Plasmodium gallinaceum]CRG97013.1 rRNA processing WD-repeat protein, putative [Plasmodium gallinaceum]
MINKKLNIRKKKNISNVDIKEKKKVKIKEVKINDIVSCIACLSKDKKILNKNKEDILSNVSEESDSSSCKNDIKKKKKKKCENVSFDKYDTLDNIFNDEKKSKKIIFEDSIISNDKKYIYEDELNISKNDALILNGKIYKDVGTLEIHLFNYNDDIFNIYDDVIIDNYPLCLEIINNCYYQNKNIVAIGTLNSDIGLWDINNIDTLEPLSYLGNSHEDIKKEEKKKKMQKKEKKEKKKNYENNLRGHTDCVTCLNSSTLINNLLCSGSKDSTVKLWDLSNLSPLHTFTFHKKKINNVAFHTKEKNILFSTSSDKTLKIYDIRKNTFGLNINLTSTPESTIWSKYEEHVIFLSDVNGYINKIDIRNIKSSNMIENSILKFKAFDKSCVSLLSTYYKDLTLAGSEDGIIKAYDFSKVSENEPFCVFTKNIKKNLFYMKDNEDWPNVIFLGSDKLYDWDLKSCEEIYKHFNL